MNNLYQKYLDNLAEGNELVKKNLLSTSDSKEDLLNQIQRNSQRTYQLRLENDEILNKILYSRRAEELTEQDVEDLKEFADQLFVFAHQNDVGTSLGIHRLLLDYAELKGDRNLRIRQLYHLGTALYYMNPMMVELGVNLFGKEITRYFQEAAEYLSQYEEIGDAQTQGYIIRSLTNLCTTDERFICKHQPCIPYDNVSSFHEYQKSFDAMMEVYNNPRYRELTPNFPWEKAVYNLHFNRSLYYQFLQKYHPREILEKIYESSEYCYHHQEQLATFRYSTKEARLEQVHATIMWQMGLISVTELADTLWEIVRHADPDDFSPGGITVNLQMPLYLEFAYRSMKSADKERYKERLQQVLRNTHDYLLKAPHNEFSSLVTRAVGESIRYRAQHNLSLQKRLFDSLLFCHPPTYIHVRMSAYLSRMLFEHMVDAVPEKLLGIYDIYDVDELRERREELAGHVYMCSLYHDVGKIMLLDYVGIYGRKLLDEEFAAIQLHTNIGAALLQKVEPKELSTVALHHHRFYNEMAGYPADCPPCEPQYKPIVDIVSVSDSLEAATDNIGRCYSAPKTFAMIVDELRKGSGTRYSPDVVGLFDDEEFYAEVEQKLALQRRNIYFEAYGKAED